MFNHFLRISSTDTRFSCALRSLVTGAQRCPSRIPSRRGTAATARSRARGARSASSASSQARIAAADRAAAEAAERLPRDGRRSALNERQARPLVVDSLDERGEGAPCEPRRADPVPREAHRVVHPPPRNRADERDVVGGDVDRAAPGRLDLRLREPGQQPPQAELRPARRRRVVREPPVDAVAVADRAGARAHQHATVVRRPEVVEEHAGVHDPLAARPADLGEEVGHRLGQDDVAPEDGQPAADRPPVGRSGVRRDDHVRRGHGAPVRVQRAVTAQRRGRSLVQLHARRRARHGEVRARGALDAPSPRPGRRRRGGSVGRSRARAARPPRRDVPTARAASTCSSTTASCDGVVETWSIPASLQPRVLAAPFEERADSGHDQVACAAELQRCAVAEERAQRGEVRPVAVTEAAVAAARPEAAELRFEQRDAQRRVTLAQRERRPQPCVAAADDRDVRLEVVRERCGALAGRRRREATTRARFPAARTGAARLRAYKPSRSATMPEERQATSAWKRASSRNDARSSSSAASSL